MKKTNDRAQKNTTTAMTLLLAFFLVGLIAFGYFKDVQAEENLAAHSAIPSDEVASTAGMLENLKIPYFMKPTVKILVNKVDDDGERITYKVVQLDVEKNFERQVAAVALRPFSDEALLEEDTFHIANVTVEWKNETGRTITLNGDPSGWNIIELDHSLAEDISNRRSITIKEAENYKFKAPTNMSVS